jgi:hypothetical protein
MKVNPIWQAAEDERLIAEEKYTHARLTFEVEIKAAQEVVNQLQLKWHEAVIHLNAEIEAANQKVRTHEQFLKEEE